jgi:hypothetical protein
MASARKDYLTIVSGLPRSGTSMMMKILEAGGIPPLIDHVREADEDNPKGYYEFEPVKKTKKDASWLKDAGGKVVKMVHLLLLDLPVGYDYRVVFMRRKMDEVIKSQNVMLERKGKGMGDLPEDRIAKSFEKQIDEVFSFVASRPDFKMLEVSYNDVLSDAGPVIDQVNAFLDGDLNRDAMLEVVDPSLYRQRK